MANVKKVGYAQLEPNRLSGQFTKTIISQYPLGDALDLVENGQVVAVSAGVNGPEVVLPAEDLPLYLNYSEVYVEDGGADHDFAIMNHEGNIAQGETVGYPRLFSLEKGDTFTTNALAEMSTVAYEAITPGDVFGADAEGNWVADGVLSPVKVVKTTDMPDGQPAVKFIVE